ncbi:MAG TPA: dimethylmenaquinone methyltransferase [Chloroflexi bacterium]|jgi:regulator of RNase E activity RraA|nr:dimethylmenaquinone methyltransferase [Chloroflexota bacterium]HBY46132.1 dimethylmenaquinone methyltransferase [Chloroflexota bacterium]
MDEQALRDLCERYRAVYSGAVADVLDKRGLRGQIVHGAIQGLTTDMRVAGPAFTCKGAPATSLEPDDWDLRKAFLDALIPLSIAVVDASGDESAAHWGELMSTGARGRGCNGVVIDGGTRDVSQILEMGFPTFARYRSPASSIRRWRISGYDHAVQCGGVLVRPGDFVVGDADGVVIVPAELTVDVLEEVESLATTETRMREELLKGGRFSEVYDRYQVG